LPDCILKILPGFRCPLWQSTLFQAGFAQSTGKTERPVSEIQCNIIKSHLCGETGQRETKDGLEIGYTVGSSRISLLPHKQYHEYYGKGLRQYGKVNTFNPVFEVRYPIINARTAGTNTEE